MPAKIDAHVWGTGEVNRKQKNRQHRSTVRKSWHSKLTRQNIKLLREYHSRLSIFILDRFWKKVSGITFESLCFQPSFGATKTKISTSKRAITFDTVIGSWSTAPCRVQNSNTKRNVCSFSRQLKAERLQTSLEVNHTSLIFCHKMQILTFLPNALNNWERFDMHLFAVVFRNFLLITGQLPARDLFHARIDNCIAK